MNSKEAQKWIDELTATINSEEEYLANLYPRREWQGNGIINLQGMRAIYTIIDESHEFTCDQIATALNREEG
jgi:hypothetical protein